MEVVKSNATPLTTTERRALLDVLNVSPSRDYEEPFAIFKQTSFEDIASRLSAPRFSPPKPLELLDRHRASYVSREKLEDMLLLDEDSLKMLRSPASDGRPTLQRPNSHLSPRLARKSSLAATPDDGFSLPISPIRSIPSVSTTLGTPFKPRSLSDVLSSPSPSLSHDLPASDASTLVGNFLDQFLEDAYISPIVRQQSGTPPKLRLKNLHGTSAFASPSPGTHATPSRHDFKFSTACQPVYFTPTRKRSATDATSPLATPPNNDLATTLFDLSPLTPLSSPDTSPEAPLSRMTRQLPQKRGKRVILVSSPSSATPSTPAKRKIAPPQRGRRKLRRLRNSSPSPYPSDDYQQSDLGALAPDLDLSSIHRRRQELGLRAIANMPTISRVSELRSSSPARASASSSASPEPSSPIVFTFRDLPPYVERRHDLIEAAYRRYPASSYYQPPESDIQTPYDLFSPPPISGMYNAPRSPWDLYTPRFVRGCGPSKVGACPICIEPRDRGGRGKKVWFAMKFSAYNYHMQYAHGISATTTQPFSPPVRFRQVRRERIAKGERTMIMEGLCHQCKKWVAVEGVKDVEVKVKELFWWKHAATCHHGRHIDGDNDFWEDDEVKRKLTTMGACGKA
ncbi:hypothetical protein HDZ31DRAFT_65784 [Schizophyllum fasciatum]